MISHFITQASRRKLQLTMARLNKAISRLNHKLLAKNGVCNELIKHLGPDASQKLLELFN